ncbi:hypothetical protein FO519_003361 [Halicephalobus sp. NKZ332]|nr:hypothetical protein FO519_003361 [Halicephalobus sp. NKZ332]
MVRTYAYNPSTQSAGLPGSRKPPPELEEENYRQPQVVENKVYRTPPPFNNLPPQNLDVSLSSSSTGSNDIPTRPQIVSGSTQLFGVRSILINGQQFYQPIDPQLNYLINKEFAAIGLLGNQRESSAAPSDPAQSQRTSAQKKNDFQHQQTTMAFFQMATQPQVFHSLSYSNLPQLNNSNNSSNSQSLSQQIPRSDSVKAFSEFGRAIQRNSVGMPIVYGRSIENSVKKDKEMIEDLPWARGNPQPRSGKRGTAHWNAGQRIAPVPSSIYAVSLLSITKSPNLLAQNKEPITVTRELVDGSNYRSVIASPPPPLHLYDQFDSDPYSSLNYAPPLPVNMPSLNMKSEVNTYGSFYNDPVSMARQSYVPSNNYQYSSIGTHDPKSEKEQHKMELLQQIEDNRLRKEYEKLRERRIEEREMWRSQVFQARQQAEIDAEQNAAKVKALAMEKKSLALASLHTNLGKQNRSGMDSRDDHRYRRNSGTDGMSGPERKLEWWEKKNTFNEQRGKSPVIPTLRNKMNQGNGQHPVEHEIIRESTPVTPVRARELTPQRRSSSHTPTPVNRRSPAPPRPESRPIRPAARASARRNIPSAHEKFETPNLNGTNESLRRLSSTQRELEQEQERLHNALNENQYDHRVF